MIVEFGQFEKDIGFELDEANFSAAGEGIVEVYFGSGKVGDLEFG
ncbi:MAG: hypothetical protein ABSG97_09005 [Sedimentisphaerales bacterium]